MKSLFRSPGQRSKPAQPWSAAVLWLLLHFGCSVGRADEQEYRLTRYLMSNYDPAVRPSFNSSLSLRVDLDLSLLQLLDVDEKSQTISTNCRLTQRWTDAHLKWNASDFGGIGVLRIPSGQVWKPDLVLYNNARGDYHAGHLGSNVIVRWTGEVLFPVQAVLSSACRLDLHYFPFDVHLCELQFVSWTYDSQQVELEPAQTTDGLGRFLRHGEFELLEMTVAQQVHPPPDASASTAAASTAAGEEGDSVAATAAPQYRGVTYTLRLRRRPGSQLLHLVLPCVVVNALALLGFLVPCESGEKVTLGINTLLCLAVFLVVVRDSLPPAASVPLLSVYYGLSTCVVACTTALSVVTLSLHHRGSRGAEVPRGLRRLVLGFLARLLLLGCCGPSGDERKNHHQRHDSSRESSKSSRLQPPSPSLDSDKLELDHIERYNFSPRLRHRKEFCAGLGSVLGGGVPPPPVPGPAVDGSSDEFEKQFLRVLAKVYQTIEKNELRVAERDRRDALRGEWHQVAVVCDRFLLAAFLLSIAVAACVVLFSAAPQPNRP
ncbi:neuronal acetylcholine receptor subunit alpha-10-like [Dermacentor andersoni]|uniref:neuronal acetylcholine receptor subunit alpha-10-like n=1 Tax=Dermacentor andersoni TaxID=34620 RepID=UPI002155984F|nr:neuronal acetylcholine receptor subunit alpha-10-like [Dermacentor andersoni]